MKQSSRIIPVAASLAQAEGEEGLGQAACDHRLLQGRLRHGCAIKHNTSTQGRAWLEAIAEAARPSGQVDPADDAAASASDAGFMHLAGMR